VDSHHRAALCRESEGAADEPDPCVAAPEPVKDTYRALGSTKLVKTLARTRASGSGFDPDLVTRQTLKRLAARYLSLQDEIYEIEDQRDPLERAVNPTLLSLSGIGLVTAAVLLVAAGDNPERLTTRATFAALAGVAPQPAPSGQRTRQQLSRGGNRQADAALQRIVLLCRRHREPRTMAYFARRENRHALERSALEDRDRELSGQATFITLGWRAGEVILSTVLILVVPEPTVFLLRWWAMTVADWQDAYLVILVKR
jgi:transposase